MPIPVVIHEQWQAGAGTPIKYGFDINAQVSVTQNGNTGNFTFSGSITVFNNPNNSKNSWEASDFATFLKGDTNLQNWGGFGHSYKKPLPYGGNGPTGDIILQGRGDTKRPGPNGYSLWSTNGGMLLNEDTSQFSRTFNFSIPYTLTLNEDPEQVVLGYNGSGANNANSYTWHRYEKYVLVKDFINNGEIAFDYRPGERLTGGSWKSLNRDGGVCERNSSWYEMRTRDGDKNASGDPPEINRSGWKNMKKIGAA